MKAEKGHPLEKGLLYPVLGALVALGAPLGLFVMRMALMRNASLRVALDELSGNAPTYVYLVVSTTAVLVALARVLGKKADRLEESSSTDALTHLGNRRAFDDRLALELARSKRYGSPLSLLLIDVDHLKRINDERGHGGGDDALRKVADAIFASRRATDIAARWGGDEFVLLAPGIDANEAQRLAERVQSSLYRPGDGFTPTVSIGVAEARSLDDPTPEALCAAADAALYEAKAGGRNRVRVATPRP